MKWTTHRGVEFCKGIVASKLFETKKGQQKDHKYGKLLQKNWKK
jgi:hypothetical protein